MTGNLTIKYRRYKPTAIPVTWNDEMDDFTAKAGVPKLGGEPVGNNRYYGANDTRRGTGLALGY